MKYIFFQFIAPLPPNITATVQSATTIDVEWTTTSKEVTHFFLIISRLNELSRITKLKGFQKFFRFNNLSKLMNKASSTSPSMDLITLNYLQMYIQLFE